MSLVVIRAATSITRRDRPRAAADMPTRTGDASHFPRIEVDAATRVAKKPATTVQARLEYFFKTARCETGSKESKLLATAPRKTRRRPPKAVEADAMSPATSKAPDIASPSYWPWSSIRASPQGCHVSLVRYFLHIHALINRTYRRLVEFLRDFVLGLGHQAVTQGAKQLSRAGRNLLPLNGRYKNFPNPFSGH